MGHRREFGLTSDPDVAEAIRLWRVEQRKIGTYPGTRTIGSFAANGLPMIFQSGLAFIRSLPMMPRIGRNGMPF
jgi:hypothetical protein